MFYYIWKDQQVFNVGVNGPEFFNLPESHIKGAELETNWVPADDWLLSADIRVLRHGAHRCDRHRLRLSGQGDFQKGHELPLSPESHGHCGNRSQDLRISAASNLNLHADYRYQSHSKVKFSPQVPIDEYTVALEVNARIGVLHSARIGNTSSRCLATT